MEDHLHVAPQGAQLRILQMADVAPLQGDLPAGRLEETDQQPGRRALAASRLTDDRERLATLDGKGHPVYRLNRTYLAAQNPGADREVLDQVFDNDQVRILLGVRRRGLLCGRAHSFGAISCSQISSRSIWVRWQATRWPGSTGASSGRTSSLRPLLRGA